MSSDVGDVLFCHVVHAIPDTPPLRPYIHPIRIPSPHPSMVYNTKKHKSRYVRAQKLAISNSVRKKFNV